METVETIGIGILIIIAIISGINLLFKGQEEEIEEPKPKIAFLFSFQPWINDPTRYLLVYAETEQEAREIGCKKCRYNSGEEVKPERLTLCTYGI